MALVNTVFHTVKHFSENYPKFRHAPSKKSANLVLGRISLKNLGFDGRKIIGLPGAQNY